MIADGLLLPAGGDEALQVSTCAKGSRVLMTSPQAPWGRTLHGLSTLCTRAVMPPGSRAAPCLGGYGDPKY